MSAYTPPAAADFDDGDPFDPAKVLAGFTDLGTAINNNVNTGNISGSAVLEQRVFHDGAVREVWHANTRSLSMAHIVSVNLATSIPLVGASIFDVTEASIDFYLRAAATVRMHGGVSYMKCKTSAAFPAAAFDFNLQPSIILNGSEVPAAGLRIVEAAFPAGVCNRGIAAQAVYTGSLSAGRHRVHLRADWSGSTSAAAASDLNIFQFSGLAGLTVFATYA